MGNRQRYDTLDLEKYICAMSTDTTSPTFLSKQDAQHMQHMLHTSKYYLFLGTTDERKRMCETGSNVVTIGFMIEEQASSKDVVLGHLHATKLRHLMEVEEDATTEVLERIQHDAQAWVLDHGQVYYDALLESEEWNVENLFLEEDVSKRVTSSFSS